MHFYRASRAAAGIFLVLSTAACFDLESKANFEKSGKGQLQLKMIATRQFYDTTGGKDFCKEGTEQDSLSKTVTTLEIGRETATCLAVTDIPDVTKVQNLQRGPLVLKQLTPTTYSLAWNLKDNKKDMSSAPEEQKNMLRQAFAGKSLTINLSAPYITSATGKNLKDSVSTTEWIIPMAEALELSPRRYESFEAEFALCKPRLFGLWCS